MTAPEQPDLGAAYPSRTWEGHGRPRLGIWYGQLSSAWAGWTDPLMGQAVVLTHEGEGYIRVRTAEGKGHKILESTAFRFRPAVVDQRHPLEERTWRGHGYPQFGFWLGTGGGATDDMLGYPVIVSEATGWVRFDTGMDLVTKMPRDEVFRFIPARLVPEPEGAAAQDGGTEADTADEAPGAGQVGRGSDAGRWPLRTWAEHGSPLFGIWHGTAEPKPEGVDELLLGQPVLLSAGPEPGWVRIDGGSAAPVGMKLRAHIPFRLHPAALATDEGMLPPEAPAEKSWLAGPYTGRRASLGVPPAGELAAEALAGCFTAADLQHFVTQVDKRRRWRGRRAKATGPLSGLLRVLTAAHERAKPKPAAGVMRVYDSLGAETPVEVELADGTRTRDIPKGAEFWLPDGSAPGNYFLELGSMPGTGTGFRSPVFLAGGRDVAGK